MFDEQLFEEAVKLFVDSYCGMEKVRKETMLLCSFYAGEINEQTVNEFCPYAGFGKFGASVSARIVGKLARMLSLEEAVQKLTEFKALEQSVTIYPPIAPKPLAEIFVKCGIITGITDWKLYSLGLKNEPILEKARSFFGWWEIILENGALMKARIFKPYSASAAKLITESPKGKAETDLVIPAFIRNSVNVYKTEEIFLVGNIIAALKWRIDILGENEYGKTICFADALIDEDGYPHASVYIPNQDEIPYLFGTRAGKVFFGISLQHGAKKFMRFNAEEPIELEDGSTITFSEPCGVWFAPDDEEKIVGAVSLEKEAYAFYGDPNHPKERFAPASLRGAVYEFTKIKERKDE